MRAIRYFAFLTILVFAGCWSIDSKAGNSRDDTPVERASATPTPRVSPTPKVTPTMSKEKPSGGFMANLPSDFEQPTDDAGRLLLKEYGSLFATGNGAIAPKKVVFKDDADVKAFQASAPQSTETIGGMTVTLQTPAMTALKAAIAEARAAGLSIGPRGGDSSKRGYQQTVTLWASRVNPGFVYWVGKGRVTQAEASRIKALTPFQQVPEILRLEQDGIFFAKDLSKSIIYSVAPPGTSQHLAMLALDVKENENPRVRQILAKNGWFQTVSSDLPHFTYLGVSESDLPGLGLKQITNSGRTFWVPDI
ncbi:MAG TPA: hypothetical protein PLP07_06855 [Pyrinomonadaceae bacterium]|nr:hypothetical protein [Chloracidobacterium sp.]MBP9936212.1 hypothetical protein [Pyrinomonadaceae bacterium]MBK9439550.1 hypothetical protein [Chloracidobacterium sp.]MBK9768539.1 hypothetical protein [Chloracidobacterium sp.]MBL0239163.1 hypothetical protein [Chloracidobacterium sp.]